MSKVKTPTLTEIAAGINKHLVRFEADPKINTRYGGPQGTSAYYYARAWRTGNRVAVSYVTYQGTRKITRAEALAYLDWLNAGNVGKHYDQQRQERGW